MQLGGALLCGILCYLTFGKFLPWCWRLVKKLWGWLVDMAKKIQV